MQQREERLVAAQRAEVARAAEMRKNANRDKTTALEVKSGERRGGDISSDDEDDEAGAVMKPGTHGMTAEEEEAMKEAKEKFDAQRKKRDAQKMADAKEKKEREEKKLIVKDYACFTTNFTVLATTLLVLHPFRMSQLANHSPLQ